MLKETEKTIRRQNNQTNQSQNRDVRKIIKAEDDYYKPVIVGYSQNNNYIKYESNGDRNRTLSVKEYLNEVKPYLKDIINELQKSKAWKIQLTIAVKFFF